MEKVRIGMTDSTFFYGANSARPGEGKFLPITQFSPLEMLLRAQILQCCGRIMVALPLPRD